MAFREVRKAWEEQLKKNKNHKSAKEAEV